MHGLIAADGLFLLLSVGCFGLAFAGHWAFGLLPFFLIAILFSGIYKDKIFYWLFLSSLSIGIGVLHAGVAYFYPSDIFLVLVLFGIINNTKLRGVEIAPLMRYFVLMAIAIFISIIVNIPNYNTRYLVSGILYLVIFIKFIVFYQLGYLKGVANEEETTVKIFYISALLSVLAATYQVFIQKEPRAIAIGAWGLIGGHHSGLGTFLIIPTALSISRLFRNLPSRWFDVVVLLASIYGILLAQSRSSLGALAIAIPVLIVRNIFSHKERRWKLVVAIVVAITILAILFGETVFSRTFQVKGGIDISSYSRPFVWLGALQSYADYPLYRRIFGCGVGAYEVNNRLPFSIWGEIFSPGAHNHYLHVLVEAGMVGLACFLLLWFKMYLHLFRLMKKRPEVFGCWMVLLALLIGGMVQENLWMNFWHGETVPAFLFFTGFYLGLARNGDNSLYGSNKQLETNRK